MLCSIPIAAHDFADWARLFVHWEIGLLNELGFGLDLARCAATGITDDLDLCLAAHGRTESPRRGRRTVSRAAAFLARLPAWPASRQRASTLDLLAEAAVDGAFFWINGCLRRLAKSCTGERRFSSGCSPSARSPNRNRLLPPGLSFNAHVPRPRGNGQFLSVLGCGPRLVRRDRKPIASPRWWKTRAKLNIPYFWPKHRKHVRSISEISQNTGYSVSARRWVESTAGSWVKYRSRT